MAKRAHSFDWVIRCGYTACSRCGLLRLKNDMSQKAAKALCPGRED
jgi:hypothetical protein